MTTNAYIPEAIAIAKIQEFETRYDLLQYQLEGWSIWPLFRSRLTRRLQNFTIDYGAPNAFRKSELIPIACRDFASYFSLRKSRFVAVGYASNLLDKDGESFKDIFFDELLESLPEFSKIEHLVGKSFLLEREHARIKADITTTTIKLIAGILARVYPPSDDLIRIAKAINQSVREGLALSEWEERSVTVSLQNFHWQKKLYSLLLRRLAPSFLFLVTAYGDHALIAAARELHIEVVEFQHGFIDRYHVGYSWTSYAKAYKTCMPIPDRIFLYGEHWMSELLVNGFWNSELFPVGSLRLDEHRSNEDVIKEDRYSILVTTQGVDTPGLMSFLTEFLKLAQDKLDFNLYIKLHPGEHNKDIYQAAFQSCKQVVILLSSEQPGTLEMILRSHLHLSIYSTCHYEALCLRTPTAILALTGYEHVSDLYERGYAPLIHTPQELLDYVLQTPKDNLSKEIVDYYFKPDALKNMKKELAL